MSDLAEQKRVRIGLASKQQRLAADPEVSVWVEASAGTGKTKVLSDRVLRLLLSGASPARILCLTYTKAAAVEMSNRIADKLSLWAVIEDEKLNDELSVLLGEDIRQKNNAEEIVKQARRLFAILLDTPGGMKIQTIHSFCQEILKRFPLEAKISPYFEIMDDRSSREAIEDIKRDMLNGDLSSKTGEALAFLIAESGELKFPDVMKSITDRRNWLDEVLQKYDTIDDMISNVADVLGVKVDDTSEGVEQRAWEVLDMQKVKVVIRALHCGTKTSIGIAAWLAEAVESRNLVDMEKILFTEGRPKKKFLVKDSVAAVPEALDALEELNGWLFEVLGRLKSLNLLVATKAVLTVAEELLGRYQNYKKIHSKMDYNDLIVLTKHLLEAPDVAEWVLYKLDGGIDNVLIDEAQDTSPEQWAIVKALTKEFFAGVGGHLTQPTLFVVGDRKQSIYSFQGADPQEFEKMHNYFANKITNFRNVSMEVSFRSTAAVLDVVNVVFASEKARKGVAKEGQNIAHVPSRIGDGGRVEFWPLVEPDEDDVSDKIWLPPVERITTMSASAKLAKQIAENIKHKVESKVLLQSKGRPLRYSDFLILVQRRNAFVEEIVRACKNIGVSISGVDKIKLREQIVVDDLMAIAKFVLLPEDDLNLACVLKTPFVGLDDNDLFELCYNRGKISLWSRLCENDKYVQTVEVLRELRENGRRVRPFEFFSYLLGKLGGRKKFVERLGPDCEDALDEFVNLSLDFERGHIPSMQLFVEWIAKDEVEVKRDLEQSDVDAVRLMTVHGAKGLQAPVVILPDTVRVKNLNREARWLKHGDLLFYPLGKKYYDDNCCKLLDEEKQSALDEYHRLLYVALTRAEECLCICGFKQKNAPSEESWYEICKKALADIVCEKDSILVYEVKQQAETAGEKENSGAKFDLKVPSWIGEMVKEEKALVKPLVPSHQDEDEGAALSPLAYRHDVRLYSRGKIIHKLLQFLPMVEIQNRQKAAENFLQVQAAEFSLEEREKIVTELMCLLNDEKLAPLFGKNSSAEVALMGVVGDRIVSGQVDRLVVSEDKVMIVDYKTNRPAAQTINEVPKAYLKQMIAYKELVSRIYENKKVEAYILWTNTTNIMRIE